MNRHWGDLVAAKTASHGPLTLGIDPVLADIPSCFRTGGMAASEAVRGYVRFLLDTTADQVGFVKFNAAFFEALGTKGIEVLANVMAEAKKKGHGVILDAKRGDVGGTAAAYAQAYLTPASAGSLSDLEADCLTVNPFLGPDTLEPLVACARKFGKGLFVLVKTSNPGSGWLQDKAIDGVRVSDRVAELVAQWSAETAGACGLGAVGAVVGATYPEEGKRLRTLMPNSIFLAPGLGPQGGKSEDIAALHRADGTGILVPVQRGITKVDDLSISQDAYAALVRERVERYRKAL